MAYDQYANYQAPPRQYMNTPQQTPQSYQERPQQHPIQAQNGGYNGYDQGQDDYGYGNGQQNGYQQGHQPYGGGYDEYNDQYAQQGRPPPQQRPPPQRQQYQEDYHQGMPPPQQRGPPPMRGRGGPMRGAPRGGPRGAPRGGAPRGPPRQDPNYGYDQGYDQSYGEAGYNPGDQYGGGRMQALPQQNQMNGRPPMPRNDSGGRPPMGRQPSNEQRPTMRPQDQDYRGPNDQMPRNPSNARLPPNGSLPTPEGAYPGDRQQSARRPPPRERILQPVLSPVVPTQDNAFPMFPAPGMKANSAPPNQSRSIEAQIGKMQLGNDIFSDDDKPRPSTSASNGSQRRRGPNAYHDSGYEAGYDTRSFDEQGANNRYPAPDQQRPQQSPPRARRSPPHPVQRPGTAGGMRTHDRLNASMPPPQAPFANAPINNPPQSLDQDPTPRVPQQQFAQAQTNDGYHGPESPNYIPDRPATANDTRAPSNLNDREHPATQQSRSFSRPQPYPPPAQPTNGHQRAASVSSVLDDYYGGSDGEDKNNKQAAGDEDMPNFDAIPQQKTGHQRNDTLHLTSPSPDANPPPMPHLPHSDQAQASESNRTNDFYQQAQMTRSQPDLRGAAGAQNGGQSFEMAGDAPRMPPMSRNNGTPQPGGRGMPMPARGGYRNGPPQGPGPRLMTPQPQGHNEGEFMAPPLRRGATDLQGWESQRGPGGKPSLDSQRPGGAYNQDGRQRQQGPNGMGPNGMGPNGMGPNGMGPNGQPGNFRPNNAPPGHPDALPHHAVPVRPGLMDNRGPNSISPQGQGVGGRPPPVRQYDSGQSAASNGGPPGRTSEDKKKPEPVTQYELENLRNQVRARPNDFNTQLTLVKKLAEASVVLADAGGLVTDARTKSKNRQLFISEALKNLKKLINQGHSESMFYMADCYGSGTLGLENDPKEAFTLYQSAAKLGHAQSAYRTAFCCEMGAEDGGGTRKDLVKAVQWYRRAAALGDTAAMYKVGMISMKGLLAQPKNLGEAVNWLKKAADNADAQNPHALHELGLLYEGLKESAVRKDDRFAFDYFKRSADLGYKFSQFRLGQAYEFGTIGCPIDARQSIAWYTRAAKQEEHQAELALSGWYLTGSAGILEQSDTEAYLWARKASTAEPPLAKAMFAMGYFTEVGIGCPRSLEEAKRWYGRAAAYKFPKAQERLEELRKGGSKAQKSRERLSRSDRKHQDENCTVM